MFMLSRLSSAGQQFKHPMTQGNPLGMYQGFSGQGLSGQGGQGQGMQGGFGNNAAAFGAFGMSNGMDNMAAQRAMLEAAQAGQMQQQMNQGGGFNAGGFPGAGGLGNMGGGPPDWLGQSFGRGDHDKKDEEQGYRGPM
jgi:hypothetical protein